MKKICTWCLIEQDISNFYKKGINGYYSHCKKCNIKKTNLWAKNNPLKHREELKKRGDSFYLWLIKENFPEGFQVLCFNCNLGRSITLDKICPHKL